MWTIWPRVVVGRKANVHRRSVGFDVLLMLTASCTEVARAVVVELAGRPRLAAARQQDPIADGSIAVVVRVHVRNRGVEHTRELVKIAAARSLVGRGASEGRSGS